MPESSVALDRLALKCRGGDESALAALLESLRPSVRKMASRAARRAANCGLTIPAEDFESMFGEAVWEACQGYDGSTSYVRRLSVFLKRAEADVWRQYRNLQNGRPKYTAASMWSLDAMLSTERDAPCDMNFAFAF